MMPDGAVRLLGVGLVLAAALAPAAAQENLDRGKTPQQMFNTDCGICHRSAKGLGTSMGSWQLSGFLAEHYTTSKAAASALTGYLLSTRRAEPEAKQQRRRPRPTSRVKQNKKQKSN
jgi:mono/diheme cytochrome c family protein